MQASIAHLVTIFTLNWFSIEFRRVPCSFDLSILSTKKNFFQALKIYLTPTLCLLISIVVSILTCHVGGRDLIPCRETGWMLLSFPGGSDSKESTCNAGDLGSIPGLRISPGGGHGNPLLCSCLKNPHGQRSLTGYSPWGPKEWDTTEQVSTAQRFSFLRLKNERSWTSLVVQWFRIHLPMQETWV